jgi:LmbE family N-acetylglucosaminyl deacetylase
LETTLRLMAILAHPDDESLGLGPVLAKYAREGVETYLLSATRGEVGWFGPPAENPGPAALGAIRERELHAAAAELGIRRLEFLDAIDGQLDQADPQVCLARIAAFIRQARPQVVVSFGPDGDYGHPDHIAISQLTSGALVCAADPDFQSQSGPAHRVGKFYYMVNSTQLGDLLRKNVGEIGIEVAGVQRELVTWQDWAITTRVNLDQEIDWQTARRAIFCHQSQLPSLGDAIHMPDETWREIILNQNAFYRVFCLVTAPLPDQETDLFGGYR